MDTKKENKRKKVKLYLTAATSCIFLVGILAVLVTPETSLAKGKPGGGGGNGTDPDWNYVASISGGSWDGVTADQVWGADIPARTGAGDVSTGGTNPTMSFGIGADQAISNNVQTGTPLVIAGYAVTGIVIFSETNASGEVSGLRMILVAPDTGSKKQLGVRVGVVETGVIPADANLTLTPDGPLEVTLDTFVKGKLTPGDVVDELVMGAIQYTPLQAP